MGGVQNGRDALELIACGATHVALGTVLFADPGCADARARRARDEARARRLRDAGRCVSARARRPLPNWPTDPTRSRLHAR